MVKRIGTARTKTRSLYKKHIRTKGKISISSYFAKFNAGDRVLLKQDSAVHSGPVFRRFYGKIAVVAGKTGRCYQVKLKDGGKEKTLIVHPVHLRKMGGV